MSKNEHTTDAQYETIEERDALEEYWKVIAGTGRRTTHGRYDNPEAAIEHARALIEHDGDFDYEVDEDPDVIYSVWQAYSEERDTLVAVDHYELDLEFDGLDYD